MTSAAQHMMNIFAGHTGAHGTHGEPYQDPGKLKWEIKRTARTLRDPVTVDLWDLHLKGERPLGIIPITEQGLCSWGSIDVDKYDEDFSDVISSIQKVKFPLVPCFSKSGGLHLFLFLETPKPAGVVQTVLRDMAAMLGLAGSEIFPKQTQILADRGDLGNWMVMPYFGGTYDGKLKEQVGVKKTGAHMSISEFIKIAESSRVSDADFNNLGKRKKAAKGNGTISAPTFQDGPPCLQHLADIGFPEGGRNNSLFHMGIYFRRKEPNGWKRALEEANQQLIRPPLSSEELATTIRSLEKKEYEYTCKVDPMCSHCDSLLCRTRKYGVGDEGNVPMISGISKLDTRPAVWFVDVVNTRLELSTEQLQNYQLFQRACMEEADHVFGSMKQATWVQMLNEAMQSLIKIDAPEDIGVKGRFDELLEEFLTNRMVSERKEDLLRGHPWEDTENDKYYFTLGSLQKFLHQQDMRDVDGRRIGRTKISRFITALGGEHTRMRVKFKNMRVWWVPAGAFEKMPDISVPVVPGVPI